LTHPVNGRGPDQDALARHADHVQSRSVLQYIRTGVLPDQKGPVTPVGATALASAAVPQVHTTIAVPRTPR